MMPRKVKSSNMTKKFFGQIWPGDGNAELNIGDGNAELEMGGMTEMRN